MEHQAAIEDDYTLHCPLRLPLIQHGETQFVPLQADGVPGYAAEPYNDGAFFGNMIFPAIVGEMDTYISPYPANICDTIVGHMTGENPKTLMASPETMIHDAVVDPLLETNGVDPAPRQVPPTPPSLCHRLPDRADSDLKAFLAWTRSPPLLNVLRTRMNSIGPYCSKRPMLVVQWAGSYTLHY
jgi:hypothetical protein